MMIWWRWTKLSVNAKRGCWCGWLWLVLLPISALALEPPPFCHPAYLREAYALPPEASDLGTPTLARQDLPAWRSRPTRPLLVPLRPLFPAAAVVMTGLVMLVAAGGLYLLRWRPSEQARLRARLKLIGLRWQKKKVQVGVLRRQLEQAGIVQADANRGETLAQVRCGALGWLNFFQDYYDSFRRQ